MIRRVDGSLLNFNTFPLRALRAVDAAAGWSGQQQRFIPLTMTMAPN